MRLSSSRNKVVSFLYELLRDHLPAGDVARVVHNSSETGETVFSNGYLADYAKELAERLGQDLSNDQRDDFIDPNPVAQDDCDSEVDFALIVVSTREPDFPNLGVRRAFERAFQIREFIDA